MFLIHKVEVVILTCSFHRRVKWIRWKQGYGVILETKSFPRYEGVIISVLFPKALFLLGVLPFFFNFIFFY